MRIFQVKWVGLKTLFPPAYLLLFLYPSSILAENVSLQSFISSIRAEHPLYQKEALNTDIAEQESLMQAASQDWDLEIGATQAHQEELLPAFGAEKIDQTSANVSLSRQVWRTGAFVSLDAEKAMRENEYGSNANPAFPSPEENDTQSMSITLSQPLLKNRGGLQSSLAYDLSLDSQDLSELNSLEAQENFLLTMSNEYLDWVSLYEQSNIRAKRMELAQLQVNEIRKRFEKNLVERVDLLRSLDSLKMTEQNYLLSRSQYKAQSLSLARLSNVEEVAAGQPDFALYNIPDLPALDKLLGSLESNARQLSALDKQTKQLQRQYQSIENSQLPELNLDLRTALKEEDQEGLAPGSPSSDDGQDYSVGLVFKKKLGNKSAKSEKQKLKLKIEQSQLDRQYAWMQLASEIENVYVQLVELEKVIDLNRRLLDTAEETTKEEMKIYQQGRSELTNVISSRDQIQNTRLQYAQNAVTYHRLYFQLLALSDQLLVLEK